MITKYQKAIVSWIDGYAKGNSKGTLVVGVSGGVDSALVSTLCAETHWTTFVVTMSIRQNETESTRALKHIEWLKSKYPNVKHIEIPLGDPFNSLEYTLQEGIETDNYPSVAFANVRSRLRMIALYHVAALYNGIVVGTGNKIEDFGIGFFTKYGDGGVDISPIADLLKSEVREMARLLGVSEEIVNAAPTDGLYSEPNKTDEDQIGATYDELELAMHLVETGEEPQSEREREVIEIYKRRHQANLHKMRPIPIYKKSSHEIF